MSISYQVVDAPEKRGWTAAAAILPAENSRGANAKVVLDLRHNCPVCGKPYQPGEAVLALASLCFEPRGSERTPAEYGRDQSSALTLGHHACVLPRLLTLLASFQPGRRFVDAVNDAGPLCPA